MTIDRLPAAELDERFGHIAHEIRITILQELWQADDEALSFSALRKRVGVSDSGNFNYHLGKLVSEFIQHTETGYRLTYAGRKLVGAAVSGSYSDTGEITIDSIPAGTCLYCSGEVEGTYDGGKMQLDCSKCGELIARLPVPPIVIMNHEKEELAQVVSNYFLNQIHGLSRGFCKLCQGWTQSKLSVLGEYDPVTKPPELDVAFECHACGDITHLNVGAVILYYPVVTSFLFNSGVNIHEAYIWELEAFLNPDVTLREEPQPQLNITIEANGEILAITVDESLSVIEYDRQ